MAKKIYLTQKELHKYELLGTRICQMRLKFNGLLEECIDQVFEELSEKGVRFRPKFYFGEAWGCVSGRISIEVPFYLASPELRKIHRQYFEEDVGKRSEILSILRHEIGHALNYSYRLYRRKGWQKLFGRITKPYRERYRPKYWSKAYVRHLKGHYAQKHPEEDWAETFAVWLSPHINWKRRYKRWRAIDKLIYVDRVMQEIGKRAPPNRREGRDAPYEKERRSLAAFYGIEPAEALTEEELEEYLKDLKELFPSARRRKKWIPAWRFIQRHQEEIVENVSAWIANSHKTQTRKCLRQFEAICRAYNLRLRPADYDRKLIELAVLVTYHILDGVYDLSSE